MDLYQNEKSKLINYVYFKNIRRTFYEKKAKNLN